MINEIDPTENVKALSEAGLNFGWEKLVVVVGLLGGLIGLFAYFAGK